MRSVAHPKPCRLSAIAVIIGFALLIPLQTAVVAAGKEGSAETTTKRPNVLLIVTDDMNNALGCYGHPLVKSPNIDRLAARGVRFDRAYCQAPVCNPTRASFFSGLLPETVDVLDNKMAWPKQPPGGQYMPHFFQERGYYTGTIGKILDHKRVPNQPYWNLEIREWGKFPDEEQMAERGRLSERGSSFWAKIKVPEVETGDGFVARRAVAALEREAKQQQPFFLAVGFRRPHSPYAAPSRYFDLYPPESIRLPHSPPEHLASILPAAKNGLAPHEEGALATLRGYYACISFVDAQVGLLLDALDQLKLWENTIVVFVSDHGYHTGHHGMWHKGTLFEQSARVPMIIAAPKKESGVACGRVAEILDLYPTLADLCGLEVPKSLEGISLAPLLANPQQPWQRAAFTVEARIDAEGKRTLVGHSVRTERYRYSEWDSGNQGRELYDHDNDPDEFVNLAQQPAYAETIARLQGLLQARRVNAR